MTQKLYQITIRWIDTPADADLIKPVMDDLGDWARLSVYSWFLWTEKPLAEIRAALAPKLKLKAHEGDSLAIFAIDLSEGATGWAKGWFWDWIDKGRRRNNLPGPDLLPPGALSDT